MIPVIPAADALSRKADAQILSGAMQSGFLTLSGIDDMLGLACLRHTLLSFFGAPDAVKRKILRHKYDPAQRNVYRGYFLPEPDKDALLEGIDLGPDIADPTRAGDGSDPLTEPTPLPDLPGWTMAAAGYHQALERLGVAIAKALIGGLGHDETIVEPLFSRGISTLRLFHYPEMDPGGIADRRRLRDVPDRFMMTLPHTDSGFITLLWQDDTGGLQAEIDGTWIDVPPARGGLVVNFGQMLSDWTGGRIRATRHRVLAGPQRRFSVPFFFEPAVDAVIAPLDPSSGAKPFIYGDFLWDRMVKFPNFHGVTRKPAA